MARSWNSRLHAKFTPMSVTNIHHIVIVGGGAGGLELATRLGDSMHSGRSVAVTLVERQRTHLWKPLLHEVAAGSMDPDQHQLDYLAQARWHHFLFQLGEMDGLSRARREISVAPWRDESGSEVLPRRTVHYDTLLIAVGSRTNDFGTPGARDYALSLDTQKDADRFHQRLLNACLRANAQNEPLRPDQLQVAIIGAGATGVELAAELHKTTRDLLAYGLDRINPERDLRFTIIEASPRILPVLPERLSKETTRLLRALNVQVLTSERVTEVTRDGVRTASGKLVPAELVVWAAGIKAPDFLKDLDGLETNRLNQIKVKQTLETTVDADIFAFGDCADCPWPGHPNPVPPRAQSAHQQASHLVGTMKRRLEGKAPLPWTYRDFGSLVSLGEYSTVGSLMGKLIGGAIFVEGYFARFMYVSLYKMHLLALHGFARVFFGTLARLITRRTEPRVKLH
jgi:NADH dehydrogenase